MIKGKIIEKRQETEKPSVNYRKLDALNQTMLKIFDNDPIKFFEEFKLGKDRDEKKGVSMVIGDIVDFYLLECRGDEDVFHNRFDEKFALFSGTKGTGQVYILCDELFRLTKKDTEDGKVKGSFDGRFSEAVRRVQADGKYKGKTEDKVLEDFEKNGKEYFQMLMDNEGKTVVDSSLVDKSLAVANRMKVDPFTRGIFLTTSESTDGMLEYLTHFPIQWKYRIDTKRAVDCKSELDILMIDHENKIIHPIDLKTTYDNESFDYMYIKNGYYLQNAFYHKAVSVWAKDNKMGDYKVMPLEFIVGDTSSNNRRPLVYKTSEMDVKCGMRGFELRGNHYRGVEELIDEIAWCEENNIWDCSRDSYQKNGQMILNVNYD